MVLYLSGGTAAGTHLFGRGYLSCSRMLESDFLMALVERTNHVGAENASDVFVKKLNDFMKHALGERSKRRMSSGDRKDFFRNFVNARIDNPIALVGGGGTMGFGLLMEWLKIGLPPSSFVIVDPKESRHLNRAAKREGIPCLTDIDQLRAASAIFLAIKPQEANDVVPRLKRLIGNHSLVVSIMAGKSIQFISRAIDHKNPGIVRAMPNLPGTIGRGITAAVRNHAVTLDQFELAELLLLGTGKVVWVQESLMDAITAVSGSGPAYTFYLTECLARAGERVGLPSKLAAELAHETVAGSGELLHRSPKDAATLRAEVTSRGGTTEAALKVLEAANGLESLMNRAVAAATKRANELGE